MSDRIVRHLLRLLGLDPASDIAMDVEIALRIGASRGGDARVEHAARRIGVSSDALKQRLFRRGLPGPGTLLTWGRVLDAMALYRTDGVTLETVAFERGWSSQTTVSAALRRASGLYPTEWSGDMEQLCGALVERWRGPSVASAAG